MYVYKDGASFPLKSALGACIKRGKLEESIFVSLAFYSTPL